MLNLKRYYGSFVYWIVATLFVGHQQVQGKIKVQMNWKWSQTWTSSSGLQLGEWEMWTCTREKFPLFLNPFPLLELGGIHMEFVGFNYGNWYNVIWLFSKATRRSIYMIICLNNVKVMNSQSHEITKEP